MQGQQQDKKQEKRARRRRSQGQRSALDELTPVGRANGNNRAQDAADEDAAPGHVGSKGRLRTRHGLAAVERMRGDWLRIGYEVLALEAKCRAGLSA